MAELLCPVDGCEKELTRLQVMHFRANHGGDPVEWVEENYGTEIKEMYASGRGSYSIAEQFEWLSPDLVCDIVETRSQEASLTGAHNPMKREAVVEEFTGKDNPAKRPSVREKISEAVTGHTLSEESRRKISEKNTGNEITAEHRRAVSRAASRRDTSYMQTDEYSRAVSEALEGREPTYPTPYEVEELSHKVRSGWEEDVGKTLVREGIQYEYEREFGLPSGSYYADFVSGSFVIEIKGWANERSVTKAREFLDRFPEYTYVVVGDELPCDVHLPWERRYELTGVIEGE